MGSVPQTAVPAGPAKVLIKPDIEDKEERAQRAADFRARTEIRGLVRLKQKNEMGAGTGVAGMVIDIVAMVYSKFKIGHNPNYRDSTMSTISRNPDGTWTATRPNGDTWTPGTEPGIVRYIYIIMADGEVRIGPWSKDGNGHPMLASNAAYVRDAGEVIFSADGYFVSRNAESGSYCAPREWERREFHLH